MLWFWLDSDRCASYTERPENTAQGKAPDRSRGPLDRPRLGHIAAQRDARTMARSATPTRRHANGTDTPAATNGTSGNGHGNGTKSRAQGDRLPSAGRGRQADLEGPHDRAALHAAGRPPVRHRRVGHPRGDHHQRARRGGLRAEGPRDPEGLVAAGDPGRGQQVLPRPPRHAAARALSQADDRPRRGHDRRLGHQGRLLRDR